MSLRAVGFVENWLSRNVRAKPGACDSQVGQARNYAAQLLIDANSNGISPGEIDGEFPDLPGVVARALAGAPLALAQHWTTR